MGLTNTIDTVDKRLTSEWHYSLFLFFPDVIIKFKINNMKLKVYLKYKDFLLIVYKVTKANLISTSVYNDVKLAREKSVRLVFLPPHPITKARQWVVSRSFWALVIALKNSVSFSELWLLWAWLNGIHFCFSTCRSCLNILFLLFSLGLTSLAIAAVLSEADREITGSGCAMFFELWFAERLETFPPYLPNFRLDLRLLRRQLLIDCWELLLFFFVYRARGRFPHQHVLVYYACTGYTLCQREASD
jgi:hypothetical protein